MLAKPTKWLREKDLTKPITHTGSIVDNNDPLKIGRVRVRVKEMYGDVTENHIADEDLPWINQQPASFLGNSQSTSFFSVPELGTEVSVEFPTSDPYFGYYKGGTNTVDNRNTAFDTDYPNAYGFTDEANNLFRINKQTGAWDIQHPSGNFIKIYPDTTIDVFQVSGNTFRMNPDGTTDLITTTYNITAATTNISGDVNIGGNVNVSGNVIASDNISSGKSGKSHTHSDPQGGTTSPPL